MLARRYIIHERPSRVALQVSPLERGLRNCELILPAIPFHSTAIIMHKQMTGKIKHTKGADEVNVNLLSGDVLIRGVPTLTFILFTQLSSLFARMRIIIAIITIFHADSRQIAEKWMEKKVCCKSIR